MSARRLSWLNRAWRGTKGMVRLVAVPLVIAAAPGCVRNTSLGRAATTDARVDRQDGPADRQEDRGTVDGTAEREPQGDAGRDAVIDMGPIVGGGRDAASDGDAAGEPDAANAADAAID